MLVGTVYSYVLNYLSYEHCEEVDKLVKTDDIFLYLSYLDPTPFTHTQIFIRIVPDPVKKYRNRT